MPDIPMTAGASASSDATDSALRTRARKPEDTVQGCRSFASADRKRAIATGEDMMRRRMEHSAATWTQRAELLERLEAKFIARRDIEAAQRAARLHR